MKKFKPHSFLIGLFGIINQMEAPISEPPKTVEYKILTNPRDREFIKRRTQDLVEKSADIDAVFFLDLSARPIAHLFRRVFPIFSPDKRRPEIRYLNIGNEKTSIPKELGRDPFDRETYIARFGRENIEELERQLRAPEGQRRMIVDDIYSRGNTLQLTKELLHVLDPGNSYQVFLFDSDRDYAIMPWSSYETLVADKNSHRQDPSFLAKPEQDPKRRNEGLQLRAELEKLAGEIAVEKGVTLPPIHPYWEEQSK